MVCVYNGYYVQCLQRIRCGSISEIYYVKKARCSTVQSIPYSLIYWDRVLKIHMNTFLYVHLVAIERHTRNLFSF